MGRVRAVALSCCLALIPVAARAQAPPLPSRPLTLAPAPTLTPGERRELASWLTAVRKWQRFDRHWHNAIAHDPFGRVVRRRDRPSTPAWLPAFCASHPDLAASAAAAPESRGCRVLAGFSMDLDAETLRNATLAARADREKLQKTTFFSRLHLDGLWTTTATGPRMYGLIGSHITLVDIGRIQFFGPPGVLLLSVPDSRGVRQTKLGYTWGMSVRLKDIRLFAASKNMTLFLTLTKVWVTGGGAYDRLNPAMNGFDIAGFSLAPRASR